MAGKDWDLRITQVTPNFVYTPAPTAGTTGYTLGKDKKITLNVDANLGVQPKITAVVIYADDGSEQKTGSPLGTWTLASNGTNKVDVNRNGTKVYEIKGKGNGSVEIKDTEDQDADEKFHFGVQVVIGGTPYDGDPEMINKGRLA